MDKNSNKTNLPKADAFVERVVKDPKNPPDTILLSGYVGSSSEPEHTRLYFSPDLKVYVDIPNDGILASESIPKEHSRFGGWDLWIKSEAILIHGRGPNREAARFLEGRIQQGFGAAAAAAVRGGSFERTGIACDQALGRVASPGFWKCTWYAGCGVHTNSGVGICATPACTADICNTPDCSAICWTVGCTLQCPTRQCTAPICSFFGCTGAPCGA